VRSPRLGSIGWFDFQRASEAIKIGADATEKAIDQINEAVAALSHPVTANAAPK
jgi:NTE family protein